MVVLLQTAPAGDRRCALKIKVTRTGVPKLIRSGPSPEDRLPGGKGGVIGDYYLFNSREGIKFADNGGRKWTDVIDGVFDGPPDMFAEEPRWTSEIEEPLEDAV